MKLFNFCFNLYLFPFCLQRQTLANFKVKKWCCRRHGHISQGLLLHVNGGASLPPVKLPSPSPSGAKIDPLGGQVSCLVFVDKSFPQTTNMLILYPTPYHNSAYDSDANDVIKQVNTVRRCGRCTCFNTPLPRRVALWCV